MGVGDFGLVDGEWVANGKGDAKVGKGDGTGKLVSIISGGKVDCGDARYGKVVGD